MIENWNDVHIVPEFSDQGVDCYRLAGGSFVNEYYIVSEAETRKLMNHPEVVGYEVYASLVTATSQMNSRTTRSSRSVGCQPVRGAPSVPAAHRSRGRRW